MLKEWQVQHVPILSGGTTHTFREAAQGVRVLSCRECLRSLGHEVLCATGSPGQRFEESYASFKVPFSLELQIAFMCSESMFAPGEKFRPWFRICRLASSFALTRIGRTS